MDIEAETIEFEDIDVADVKHVVGRPYRHRRAIIFITIADAQISLVDIEKLMEIGMNVAHIKTSHSTKGDKVKLIHRFDRAATFLAEKHNLLGWPCATCIELKTSVVQTGILEGEEAEINIQTDTEVILTCDVSQFDKCNEKQIFLDNPYLTSDVRIGMELNISQDEIIMCATAILSDKSVKCTITKGGVLHSMSYACMRGAIRTRPYISKKDLHLIKFAVDYQLDMIIVNYPRHIDTLKKIKRYLGPKVKRPKIITGISTQEGLLSIDDFVREADGILLAREFLAFEVDKSLYNRMNLIQSYVCAKCRQAGKPFYISGGVFQEALQTGSISTREISDVTNAVLEGTSGFVVAESQNIDYVIEVMKNMNDICASVEPLTMDRTGFWQLVSRIKMPVNAAEASAMSCAVVANQTNARCIVVPTVTGCTAYLLNWLRPNSIVIAVSTKRRTIRLLKTYRSITPLLYKGAPRRTWFNTVQARINFAIQYALEMHWIEFGDHYVTLEKGTEESSFCDAVRVWNCKITKKNTIECPESVHDFDIHTYPPITTDDENIKKEISRVKPVKKKDEEEEAGGSKDNDKDIDQSGIKDLKTNDSDEPEEKD